MAKAIWLITNPNSGSGNGTISNSAAAHTGRVARQTTVTVTATGVSTPATYQVTQTPLAEFATFDNGDNMSAPKTGGALTVAGKSNSAALTFAWVDESGAGVSIPTTYTAAGSNATNGEDIPGDPGASAQYAFSVQLTLPANETIESISRTLMVTTEGGQSDQIVITQAAGDPTIKVTPNAITIPQAGTAQSVNVESNTTWTVS